MRSFDPALLNHPEGRWFAVYTRANHEKRVATQLEVRGIRHFLPLYSSLRRWKDRRVRVRCVFAARLSEKRNTECFHEACRCQRAREREKEDSDKVKYRRKIKLRF